MLNINYNKSKCVVCVFTILTYANTVFAELAQPHYTVINGQKVLQTGWYIERYISGVPGPGTRGLRTLELDECREHGMDYIMQYQILTNGDTQEIMDYLDNEVVPRGMKVLLHISSNDIQDLNLVGQIVDTYKNHPAILGWYIPEEPGHGTAGFTQPELLAAYNMIKSRDTTHPVFLVVVEPLSEMAAAGWTDCTDIIGRDVYPIAEANIYDPQIVNYRTGLPNGDYYLAEYYTYDYKLDVEFAVNSLGGMPFYIVPQAFDTPGTRRYPTPFEFRYLIFAPISVGVVGGYCPFAFTYFGTDPNTSELERTAVNRATVVYPTIELLNIIKPILLKGTNGLAAYSNAGDQDFIPGKDLDKVTYILAGDSNEVVMVVANNTNNTFANVDFTVSGLDPSIRKVEVIGENRFVDIDCDNSFVDDFDSRYSIHLYRFKKPPVIIEYNGDGFPYLSGAIDLLGGESSEFDKNSNCSGCIEEIIFDSKLSYLHFSNMSDINSITLYENNSLPDEDFFLDHQEDYVIQWRIRLNSWTVPQEIDGTPIFRLDFDEPDYPGLSSGCLWQAGIYYQGGQAVAKILNGSKIGQDIIINNNDWYIFQVVVKQCSGFRKADLYVNGQYAYTQQLSSTISTGKNFGFGNHDDSGVSYDLDYIKLSTHLFPANCGDVKELGHTIAGDVNGDCKVDFKDFSEICLNWLRCFSQYDGLCEKPWLLR